MAPQANELVEIRDGPTGPRASVSGGLAVWEIAPSIDDARSGVGAWGEDWVAGLAEYHSLSRQQVEAAIAYYDSHPVEIKIRFSSAVAGISNSGGTLSLTSVTLARNNVSEPNGGFLPAVAGVSNFFGGTLTGQNSLISGQSGGANCYGLTASSDGGYNLDDGTSCGFSTANHSVSSTDPLLDPVRLQSNGGPTQTIALRVGSPAIDAIAPGTNGCGTTITTDQRGISRPQGSGCDIGAWCLFKPTLLEVSLRYRLNAVILTVPRPKGASSG